MGELVLLDINKFHEDLKDYDNAMYEKYITDFTVSYKNGKYMIVNNQGQILHELDGVTDTTCVTKKINVYAVYMKLLSYYTGTKVTEQGLNMDIVLKQMYTEGIISSYSDGEYQVVGSGGAELTIKLLSVGYEPTAILHSDSLTLHIHGELLRTESKQLDLRNMVDYYLRGIYDVHKTAITELLSIGMELQSIGVNVGLHTTHEYFTHGGVIAEVGIKDINIDGVSYKLSHGVTIYIQHRVGKGHNLLVLGEDIEGMDIRVSGNSHYGYELVDYLKESLSVKDY